MTSAAIPFVSEPAVLSTDPRFDWRRIAHLCFTSRALDDLEEQKLFPERRILYQFSARGHELSQILLGSLLTGAHDAIGAYYRSRPLLLTLGLTAEDALAGGMAKSGGVSDGRDIGVVFNLPRGSGPVVLPMAGGVGTQYTTTAGWCAPFSTIALRSATRAIATPSPSPRAEMVRWRPTDSGRP